jgi:hypothetical protein
MVQRKKPEAQRKVNGAMIKSPRVIVFLLCAASMGWAQQVETVRVGTFVPAGTLLGCTLDEPNFSSQTARVGDPVLCKTTSVEMFGRSLIPRGAYLSARLRNYRDPGHFAGKGWLQLEFTSLTLPGGSVPLDAKVISAARYKVNGEGKIQGRGHAKRDAVEWAIPLLWPVKVLTLPARGPRPELKGETRIELRLMEDLTIPESAYAGVSGPGTRTSVLMPRQEEGASVAAARLASFRPDKTAQARQTILALRDGRMYLVGDYWLENGNLDYTSGGTLHAVPLNALDVAMTKQLNAERGVAFAPGGRNR